MRAAVRTRLPQGTTIPWHGVPVPNEMDGVPGVTQPSIKPDEEMEELKPDEGAMADTEGMEGQPVPEMKSMPGMEGSGGDSPPRCPPHIVYPIYLISGRLPRIQGCWRFGGERRCGSGSSILRVRVSTGSPSGATA